jgi:hypothetical protein
MKTLAALSLSAALLAACAAPTATHAFDPLEPGVGEAIAAGIVEAVREVPTPSRVQTLVDFYEHAVRPPATIDLLLDDGRPLTLIRETTAPLQAGQRVRVYFDVDGARVEPE